MNQSENRKELLIWFQKLYGLPFLRHVMRYFPFSARTSVRRNNQVDPQCQDQNLITCFLWAQIEEKHAAKYTVPVFQYLSGKTAQTIV